VSQLIRHSIEPLTINADAKHITLQIEVAPNEPMLYADPLRLTQIFNNLLSNAVKFTSAGGRVTVRVVPERDGVSVMVEDTGLGIAEQELPHVFDKFHQTSTKATAGETGAGLGLSIVRELVLLHQGNISVTSQVGRGTTFTVFLPQASPRPLMEAPLMETAAA
jgi:signal transduction histidine kinase